MKPPEDRIAARRAAAGALRLVTYEVNNILAQLKWAKDCMVVADELELDAKGYPRKREGAWWGLAAIEAEASEVSREAQDLRQELIRQANAGEDANKNGTHAPKKTRRKK